MTKKAPFAILGFAVLAIITILFLYASPSKSNPVKQVVYETDVTEGEKGTLPTLTLDEETKQIVKMSKQLALKKIKIKLTDTDTNLKISERKFDESQVSLNDDESKSTDTLSTTASNDVKNSIREYETKKTEDIDETHISVKSVLIPSIGKASAIIAINGNQFTVGKGSKKNGVSIIDISSSSLTIVEHGKKKTIHIN